MTKNRWLTFLASVGMLLFLGVIAGRSSLDAQEKKPKTEPEKPFAGKIVVVNPARLPAGAGSAQYVLEDVAIVEIKGVRLLSGKSAELEEGQTLKFKVSVPMDNVGSILEFDSVDACKEFQAKMAQPAPAIVPNGWGPAAEMLVPPPRAAPDFQIDEPAAEDAPVGIGFPMPRPGAGWLPHVIEGQAPVSDEAELDELSESDRAVVEILEDLGADVTLRRVTVQSPAFSVVLGPGWTGTDADLKQVQKLSKLLQVEVVGEGRVTGQALESLRQAHPDAAIERKPEAYLGIGGAPHADGFVIQQVRPNSGASRAGLRVGDVLLELAGERVPDYATFRRILMPMKPGQKIEARLQRDEETLTVTVKLGKWK